MDNNQLSNEASAPQEAILPTQSELKRKQDGDSEPPTKKALTVSALKPSTEMYDKIIKLKMNDHQLRRNGYPQVHPTDQSLAKIYCPPTPLPLNRNERYCRRCKTQFTMDHYDVNRYSSCQYHPKSLAVRQGLYNKYICCERPKSHRGCQIADHHVYEWLDYNNLKGFVRPEPISAVSIPCDENIFAVDCEMLFTTDGMEAARVTVVDINLKKVYDEFIKPIAKIIDYNTAFSGITVATLAYVTKRLTDVQKDLLKIFNASTILIGHSLESDLKSLKIVHDKIVDTSILYPHSRGPPLKRALKTLADEYLNRKIQIAGSKGHDSVEDAEVCILLVKHHLRGTTVNRFLY